jgi:hypothetical protein
MTRAGDAKRWRDGEQWACSGSIQRTRATLIGGRRMDGNALKAIEFYGFMALAAWLVYSQFIASRRDRRRPHDDSASEDARDNDEEPHS